MLQQLTDDMKKAMKARDKVRLSCIRMLRAAIKNKEIELGHTLSDSDAIAVCSRLLKQRHDAAAQYAEAGREDLQEQELAEAAIIQSYLPAPLSDDELREIVAQAIRDSAASGMQDMGKVMGLVKAKAAGRADMAKLSARVKASLS